MRAVKYCLVLLIAAVVYTGMSLFAGFRGISAYNDLLEEQEKLEANRETLKQINTELENTRNALLYDHDTIRVYARDLGLGERNEKFVRIVGLGRNRAVPLFPGEIIAAEAPPFLNNKIIGMVSLFAALTVLIGFLVQDTLDLVLGPERRTPRLDPVAAAGDSISSFYGVQRPSPRPLPPEPPLPEPIGGLAEGQAEGDVDVPAPH
jgi:cell division protein FtsB